METVSVIQTVSAAMTARMLGAKRGFRKPVRIEEVLALRDIARG